MTIDTTKLRELAQKATPQNFETAQIKTGHDASIECPFCGGEGLIASEGGYCNYDGVAIGVEFYGVGKEFGAAEAYYRAANPATVLALLDELERTQGSVAIVSAALSAAERELQRLRPIESAVENLKKAKGRHNTEIAYKRLMEAHSG